MVKRAPQVSEHTGGVSRLLGVESVRAAPKPAAATAGSATTITARRARLRIPCVRAGAVTIAICAPSVAAVVIAANVRSDVRGGHR